MFLPAQLLLVLVQSGPVVVRGRSDCGIPFSLIYGFSGSQTEARVAVCSGPDGRAGVVRPRPRTHRASDASPSSSSV